jgi:hypothetical protein
VSGDVAWNGVELKAKSNTAEILSMLSAFKTQRMPADRPARVGRGRFVQPADDANAAGRLMSSIKQSIVGHVRLGELRVDPARIR